jgi:hypothetical protein
MGKGRTMPTAIVLSGGGAKGDFEVGAVRCIYDRGIRPDIICGVSVGAINAVKLRGDPVNDWSPRACASGMAGVAGSVVS